MLRLPARAAPATPAPHWTPGELMAKTPDDLAALAAAYMRTHEAVGRMLADMASSLTGHGRKYVLALAVADALNADRQ